MCRRDLKFQVALLKLQHAQQQRDGIRPARQRDQHPAARSISFRARMAFPTRMGAHTNFVVPPLGGLVLNQSAARIFNPNLSPAEPTFYFAEKNHSSNSSTAVPHPASKTLRVILHAFQRPFVCRIPITSPMSSVRDTTFKNGGSVSSRTISE